MKMVSYSNPQWANSEQTAINAQVIFEHTSPDSLPFTASASDPSPHGAIIFDAIKSNADSIPIAAYVAPAPPANAIVVAGGHFLPDHKLISALALYMSIYTSATAPASFSVCDWMGNVHNLSYSEILTLAQTALTKGTF